MNNTILAPHEIGEKIIGEKISFLEADEITRNFTYTILGKSMARFPIQEIKKVLESAQDQNVCFRFAIQGNELDLVFCSETINTRTAGYVSSLDQKKISQLILLQRTKQLSFNINDVSFFLINARLFKHIVSLCNKSLTVYYGISNNKPDLVLTVDYDGIPFDECEFFNRVKTGIPF